LGSIERELKDPDGTLAKLEGRIKSLEERIGEPGRQLNGEARPFVTWEQFRLGCRPSRKRTCINIVLTWSPL
jgi:hypothetical protein